MNFSQGGSLKRKTEEIQKHEGLEMVIFEFIKIKVELKSKTIQGIIESNVYFLAMNYLLLFSD